MTLPIKEKKIEKINLTFEVDRPDEGVFAWDKSQIETLINTINQLVDAVNLLNSKLQKEI